MEAGQLNRRLAALGLSLVLSGPALAADLPLARNVDLPRLYGGWYIVATIPNGFEKGMVGPYDVYAPDGHGGIREDFYVRRGSFAAPRRHFTVHDFIAPGTGDAHWRVQIIWPLRLPFLLLDQDPGGKYLLFGENNRRLGWIYARTPDLPDADYAALKARFAALGYDPSRFRKIVQRPEQIGKPGVWSAGIKP
ncbi:MAG: lipocalin family protein [Alphaproteobacteria bacterium]|jgi:apolipoprotein D and lipocalin family protein|nr:lipocalin family protein [Alphaproteobacteria bacterium]